MKLLSIAVPTYNRNKELSRLCHTFLFKVAQEFGDQVEIVICDNSDQQQAAINEQLLKYYPISYFKNPINLGFAGNILECVRKASARYLWIISDDDDTDFVEFTRLICWLERQQESQIKLVMLPYFQVSADGEVVIRNSAEKWDVEIDATLAELVQRGKRLPFILFSTAIVSLEKKSEVLLNEIATKFTGNDYFQIPLMLSLAGADAKVVFYDKPLQQYFPAFEGRFPLMGLVKSMDKVSDLVIDQFGIKARELKAAQYRGWLIWLLHHRTGRCKIDSADAGKIYLMKKIWTFPNPKNIFLLLLNVAPLPITRFIYNRIF